MYYISQDYTMVPEFISESKIKNKEILKYVKRYQYIKSDWNIEGD